MSDNSYLVQSDFVEKHDEFPRPPSLIRRVGIIVAYMMLAFMLLGLSLNMMESRDCLKLKRCTPSETSTGRYLVLAWFVLEGLIIYFGLRSRLPGARRRKSRIEARHEQNGVAGGSALDERTLESDRTEDVSSVTMADEPQMFRNGDQDANTVEDKLCHKQYSLAEPEDAADPEVDNETASPPLSKAESDLIEEKSRSLYGFSIAAIYLMIAGVGSIYFSILSLQRHLTVLESGNAVWFVIGWAIDVMFIISGYGLRLRKAWAEKRPCAFLPSERFSRLTRAPGGR